MGWTETYKPKGQKLEEFFGRGIGNMGEITSRILDSALVNASEWYAAVENIDNTTGRREVWCAVFLVKMWRTKEVGDFNICYKDQCESMGPCATNCPERILKLLTPTDNETTNVWRAACRERLALRKAKPPLVAGTVLVADPPISFSDGTQQAQLTIRQRRGSRVSFHGGYRLSIAYINDAFARQRIRFTPAA